jgi:hypothetical protein
MRLLRPAEARTAAPLPPVIIPNESVIPPQRHATPAVRAGV